MSVHFVVPVKTINEANGSHGHWAAKAARRKKQRLDLHLCWLDAFAEEGGAPWWPAPHLVTLTRYSAGMLDTDALPLSLKSIRDQIAAELGVTDAPTDTRVSWAYDQQKCKRGTWRVEVEIRALAPSLPSNPAIKGSIQKVGG